MSPNIKVYWIDKLWENVTQLCRNDDIYASSDIEFCWFDNLCDSSILLIRRHLCVAWHWILLNVKVLWILLYFVDKTTFMCRLILNFVELTTCVMILLNYVDATTFMCRQILNFVELTTCVKNLPNYINRWHLCVAWFLLFFKCKHLWSNYML